MIEHFKNDESNYAVWLEKNKMGYVFNYFGSESNNKLHHAQCGHLYRAKDVGSRTTLDKFCSDNYYELEAKISGLCDTKWSKCGACFK